MDRTQQGRIQEISTVVEVSKSSPEVVDYSTTSDFELTQLAGTGSSEAFEEIYKRHHKRIFNICYRMLQNVDEAEDLSQDVFVKLLRKVGSFKGEAQFTTWLHRFCVNEVLMYFRKQNKHKAVDLESILSLAEPIAPGTCNPLRMNNDNSILLRGVISSLPKGYFDAFCLHDILGFAHKEIAATLGCSEGTTKSQLFKARKKLRKEINRQSNPKSF